MVTYTSRIAEKLRAQKSTACNIQVFIHASRFKESEREYSNYISLTLPQPSSFTPTLVKYALHGLEKIYRPGYEYVKAGVLVTTIGRQDELQLNLWEAGTDPWDIEEELALSGIVDGINQKWGRILSGWRPLAWNGIGGCSRSGFLPTTPPVGVT